MSSGFFKRNLTIVIYGLMLSLSIGITGIGYHRGTKAVTGCGTKNDVFGLLMGFAGIYMAVASATGLLTSFSDIPADPCGFWYAVFMSLICVLIGFSSTIFALAVAGKGSGAQLPGKAYKEYKLGSYSKWIQSQVKDPLHWNHTKTCIIETKTCTSFNNKYLNDTVENFHNEPLTSIQSGCCKPSKDCGFTYQSPANWSEEKAVYNKNPDCKAWDNDPKVLCFNCESCKAGVADHMKRKLLKEGFVSLGLLIGFVILSIFAYRFTTFKTPGTVMV